MASFRYRDMDSQSDDEGSSSSESQGYKVSRHVAKLDTRMTAPEARKKIPLEFGPKLASSNNLGWRQTDYQGHSGPKYKQVEYTTEKPTTKNVAYNPKSPQVPKEAFVW